MPSHRRHPATRLAAAVVALLLAACAGDAGVPDVAASRTEAPTTTGQGPEDGPTREVVTDGPEAFLGRLGCDQAPDEAVEAVLAAVTTEVGLASAVAAPVEDEELGGLAIGAMVIAEDRPVAVWHWDPEAGLLRPLTPEAAALEGDDADTSLLPEPGAGGVVTYDGSRGVPLAQDCATFVGQAALPEEPAAEPEVREDVMVVEPMTASPGEVVAVTFPGGWERGIAYTLQREVAPGTWVDQWWMTSDGNGGQPVTVPAATEGYGVEDVGVDGTGPDRVLVDPATEPGEYRLCTANAVEDVCALLTVAD